MTKTGGVWWNSYCLSGETKPSRAVQYLRNVTNTWLLKANAWLASWNWKSLDFPIRFRVYQGLIFLFAFAFRGLYIRREQNQDRTHPEKCHIFNVTRRPGDPQIFYFQFAWPKQTCIPAALIFWHSSSPSNEVRSISNITPGQLWNVVSCQIQK